MVGDQSTEGDYSSFWDSQSPFVCRVKGEKMCVMFNLWTWMSKLSPMGFGNCSFPCKLFPKIYKLQFPLLNN